MVQPGYTARNPRIAGVPSHFGAFFRGFGTVHAGRACAANAGTVVGIGGFVQIIEQWCLVGIGNDKVIEVEAFVEGTVEVASDVVGCVTVELLRIFNQVQRIAQYLGTD
ncbi:Uncharacterised protein [Mycobacteroides abscessus subsp. abscessus]|nr:Uncharacterised protein [Mycobacteroides abscessus subsp. abscessus]